VQFLAAFLSQLHQGFVSSDTHQPGAKFRVATKRGKIGKCLENCLLGRVLCIGLILQNGLSSHEYCMFARTHEFAKGFVLPPEHALDQFRFEWVNLRFGESQYFSADSKTGRGKGCSPVRGRHHLAASCCLNRPETLQTCSAAHVRGMLLGPKSDIVSRSLTINARLVEIRKMSWRPPGGSAKAKPGEQTVK